MISTLEGLSYGIGDAVIGLNPVDDSVDSVMAVMERLHKVKNWLWYSYSNLCISTRYYTNGSYQKRCKSRLDIPKYSWFWKGNEAFGINGTMIEEARKLALKQGTAAGPNVMYFETGQGSELSSDAHNGADQVTMEARCYGFAKRFQPFLVNTVVGFIGPEYLYDSKQVIRAGLEDHFMG